jgi:DNA-binding MarR family transcriptional regulator
MAHMSSSFDFAQAPGHLIRRAQQIAVAEFVREMADFDITPVQFALLNALIDTPGVDQITLAKRVAFDPATLGSVIGRLELKGWVRRESDEQDRRRKLLFVSAEGVAAVGQMKAAGDKAQRNILAPLMHQERQQFMDLLNRLVIGHEGGAEPG